MLERKNQTDTDASPIGPKRNPSPESKEPSKKSDHTSDEKNFEIIRVSQVFTLCDPKNTYQIAFRQQYCIRMVCLEL